MQILVPILQRRCRRWVRVLIDSRTRVSCRSITHGWTTVLYSTSTKVQTEDEAHTGTYRQYPSDDTEDTTQQRSRLCCRPFARNCPRRLCPPVHSSEPWQPENS